MVLYNLLRLGFIKTEELAKIFKVQPQSLYAKWDHYIKQLRPYCDFDIVRGGIIVNKLKF